MHVTNADNYAHSTAKSMGIVVYGIVNRSALYTIRSDHVCLYIKQHRNIVRDTVQLSENYSRRLK